MQAEVQAQNGTGIAEKPQLDNQEFGDAKLPLNNNEGLLSLKDIEARTGGNNYSKLVRFANQGGIAELVGAVNVTGAKGVRYEPWAAGVFQRLLTASDAGAVTPSTAVAWLKANEARSNNEARSSEPPITEIAKSGNLPVMAEGTNRSLALILGPVVSIMQEVRDLLHDFRSGKAQTNTAQLAAPATPVPDRLLQDRLLTAEEAAALLACSPRSVSRHVAPVLPRKWRESDVLRYISSLEPKDAVY